VSRVVSFEAPVRIESELNRRERTNSLSVNVVIAMNDTQKEFIDRWIVYDDGDPSKCWRFVGSTKPDGYGRLKWDGKRKLAHRLAYELFVGAIPEGLELDHLCRQRDCANPSHLEPVTPRENVIRSDGPLAVKRRRRHESGGCLAKGHPLSEWDEARAHCRACDREAEAIRRQRPEKKAYHAAYSREWQKRNRERLNVAQRAWRARQKAKQDGD
jgi:hypothetical protein